MNTHFGVRKTRVQILALLPPICALVTGHYLFLVVQFLLPRGCGEESVGEERDSQEALTELLGTQRPFLVATFISVLSIISL